jgi:hypothetical protein
MENSTVVALAIEDRPRFSVAAFTEAGGIAGRDNLASLEAARGVAGRMAESCRYEAVDVYEWRDGRAVRVGGWNGKAGAR